MLIRGNELAIRTATAADASLLGKWWRDGNVMAHAGMPNGLQITDEEIKAELSEETDETNRRLMIELNGTPIGEMSYRNMNDASAEIGIKICDFRLHEKGYGTRLYKMLMRALFDDYGYTAIITSTNMNNLRAQHVYEKIGFRRVCVTSSTDQFGELESYINYRISKDAFMRLLE